MNQMKTFAAAITLLTLTSSAFAASSATLLLQGTVSSINDIVVTPNGTNKNSTKKNTGLPYTKLDTIKQDATKQRDIDGTEY